MMIEGKSKCCFTNWSVLEGSRKGDKSPDSGAILLSGLKTQPLPFTSSLGKLLHFSVA